MQIFLHFFGHLAQICSVIWRKFVRSFGVITLRRFWKFYSDKFQNNRSNVASCLPPVVNRIFAF